MNEWGIQALLWAGEFGMLNGDLALLSSERFWLLSIKYIFMINGSYSYDTLKR